MNFESDANELEFSHSASSSLNNTYEEAMSSSNIEKQTYEHDYWAMVEQYGSPLLILDQAVVRKQYRDLRKALPDVQLHYAIKPLPDEGVI